MCIFFFNCIAVSLYCPLQRAAVRACYVSGCPVHLYFDFVILLGFERNKWREMERYFKNYKVYKSKIKHIYSARDPILRK